MAWVLSGGLGVSGGLGGLGGALLPVNDSSSSRELFRQISTYQCV